jgi:hypothetical protein
MLIAAIWLLLAITAAYFLDGAGGESRTSNVVITVGASVASACSLWLIVDHATGDVGIADLVVIVLLATTISVYIRIIRLVNAPTTEDH